jgi:hypothetical protein
MILTNIDKYNVVLYNYNREFVSLVLLVLLIWVSGDIEEWYDNNSRHQPK